MTILPDAAPTNWVDKFAPPKVRPWLKMGRFDRPIGIWLLMLPGWQSIALASSANGEWPSVYLLVAFFVGAALMRAAGCAYNDIVDADIDARVARTAGRPIPSGQITKKGAFAFVVACCLISLVILLTLGLTAIILGFASLLIIAAYPFMKRITWWPQVWLGLAMNYGALLGYAAATGRVELPAILLFAGGIFWTIGYDSIYAIQDIEDDAIVGVKSSARRMGRHTRTGVAIFYALSAALFFAAGWTADLGPLFLPFVALVALHLSWQASKTSLDDPKTALMLFKSNRFTGLILFIGIVAGLWPGVAGV